MKPEKPGKDKPMAFRDDLLRILCNSRVTLGAFNRSKFMRRRDLEIAEKVVTMRDLGECFCPWYYVNQGKPTEVDYGTAECLIASSRHEGKSTRTH